MKKRAENVIGSAVLLSMALFIILSSFALAQTTTPTGPNTVTISHSARFSGENQSGYIIQAQAGNVTALVVDQRRITQAWQGYYGNVTGTITLDDTNNQTLYDWALAAPSGEIYASNGSVVQWNSMYCMNVSGIRNISGSDGAGGGPGVMYNINGSQIEKYFGINETDRDGLNETFNDTYTDATGFRVGPVTIDVLDGCSLSHPFTDEAYNSAGWQELLLTDNASLVFTSILRDNADGFYSNDGGNQDAFDFQMLVLENGHVGSETTLTNYYFFVELS